MRSIKNITLGLATVGVMFLSGCAGDYLDTIPSTSVSETTINTSLHNLYIALNGIHKEMVSQESGYQCLGGEPGFMMSRDAEADDINLDVGAIEYIRKRIIAERDKGKAIIVVSFELDEILDMSDQIAVIYDGAIQGILDPVKTNKQDLGILMAGGQLNKEEANV